MNKPQASGQTVTAQQETEDGLVPRTPNERDTSADSQAGKQPAGNGVGKAAAQDAASGRQDTDKGAEMDRVYNDEVRGGGPKDGPRR